MKAIFLTTVIFFSTFSAFARDNTAGGEDLWFSSGAETAVYGISGTIYGGSLAAAYGSGASTGLKASLFFDFENEINVMELNFLFRLYIAGRNSFSGPFFQFAGGSAVFFNREDGISLPARWGSFSAGLSFGWRFLLGNTFFIEPSVRGGYPFMAGAGLTAGVRFLTPGANNSDS